MKLNGLTNIIVSNLLKNTSDKCAKIGPKLEQSMLAKWRSVVEKRAAFSYVAGPDGQAEGS